MSLPKLGILAGSGSLPREVIAHCRNQGRAFFVLAFYGETDASTVDGVPHAWTRLGAAGAAIRCLKEEAVEELVMAGAIRRPSFASLRPDWRGARLMAKLSMRALGDDALLSLVMKELEGEGFRLIGTESLLHDALATEGSWGSARPDAQAQADIAHGFRVAHALGALDVGQAVVVQQGLVLGLEAIEGTDALIRRAGALAREGARPVLVKAKKPSQDRRADLPTIGPQTIRIAQEAGLAGIAVEAGGTLVLERETLIELADRAGMFLLGYAGNG